MFEVPGLIMVKIESQLTLYSWDMTHFYGFIWENAAQKSRKAGGSQKASVVEHLRADGGLHSGKRRKNHEN